MKLNIDRATEIAIESAKQSIERHKVGAILFQGNQYVTAFNRTFNGVIVNGKRTPYSDHAEFVVITHALHLGIDLSKATLIVVRLNKLNQLRLSKPCIHCQRLIKKMKIPRIYYSNDPLKRLLIKENFKSLI